MVVRSALVAGSLEGHLGHLVKTPQFGPSELLPMAPGKCGDAPNQPLAADRAISRERTISDSVQIESNVDNIGAARRLQRLLAGRV
jgi:hypothetical protein